MQQLQNQAYINNLNKTKGKIVRVVNKNNNYSQTFRSMRMASIKMGYNKGYLFKKIKNNIYENKIFTRLFFFGKCKKF